MLAALTLSCHTSPCFHQSPVIRGHDFNMGSDIDSIMNAMLTTGFQATALGQVSMGPANPPSNDFKTLTFSPFFLTKAVNEVNRMVSKVLTYPA